MNTVELLDACKYQISKEKGRVGPSSSYMVAKVLQISDSAVYSYYKQGKIMGDEVGVRVADLLQVPPEVVLSCLALERSKKTENDKVTQAWETVIEKCAS